jgi:hypothetical protein
LSLRRVDSSPLRGWAFSLPESSHHSAAAIGPRILLFPYEQPAPSLEDVYFTGFGVVVDASLAVRVAPGSDAEARGIRDGDVLLSVSGGTLNIASSGIVEGGVGETRTFTMRRGDQTLTFDLVGERLLGR